MAKTPNIRWLRSFVAVAEGGTVSHAARSAGIGQPAVSRHMGKLEKALGRTLFERSGRLRLSEAGEVLLPKARRIVRLHDGLFLEDPPGEDAGGRGAAGDRP